MLLDNEGVNKDHLKDTWKYYLQELSFQKKDGPQQKKKDISQEKKINIIRVSNKRLWEVTEKS